MPTGILGNCVRICRRIPNVVFTTMKGSLKTCSPSKCKSLCLATNGFIGKICANFVRIIFSVPALIRTFLRILLYWIVSLPGRILWAFKCVIHSLRSLPNVIRSVGKLLLQVARFCHPRNLRKLSLRTLLKQIRDGFWILREKSRLENLRKVRVKQILKDTCSNPRLRALVKGVVYTACVTCILCVLMVVFLEDVRVEGIRSLKVFDSNVRVFHTATPSVRRIVIVEEHHEVLKYWYEAAQDGIMPDSGLTLLHFDSHSGISPLSHLEKTFPLFRWPIRIEELHHMIQESDDYVMAAALSKLIKRYIWVWPSWDARTHGYSTEYEAYGVQLGWTKIISTQDKREYREVCGCLLTKHKHNCRVRDSLNPKNPSYGLEIPREKCTIVHRGIMEIIRDDIALEKLETEVDWLKPDEPLLLDIDADFYGSASPMAELRSAGFMEPMIQNISRAIGQVVCPRSSLQETAADRLLGSIITRVQRFRYCKFRKCADAMNLAKLRQTVMTMMTEKEAEADYYGMFCVHSQRKLEGLMDIFMKFLLTLTSQQLHRLRWVGFCLRTSPKSFDFSPYGSFRVCTEKASRDIRAVAHHAPSKGEVLNRTALLQELLYDGVISPKFVTLSRSIREGHAPREHISLIENHLLATVYQVVNKNHSSVHYDKDLFWGIHGWKLREKLVNTGGQIWSNVDVLNKS